MESKHNETFGSDLFGTNVIHGTSSASQETIEEATRVEGAPPRAGRASLSRETLKRPPTYFFLLYIPMYPETIEEHHKTLFPPP